MSDVVDIDVFAPEPRYIKFEGKEITINPPRTLDLIQLGHAVMDLDSTDGLSDADLQIKIDNLNNRIFAIIPELRDKHLSKSQVSKLVEIISEMAKPEETKALEQKGITVDGSKKAQ